MLIHKLKLTVLTLLFLATVAAGAGFVGAGAGERQAGKPRAYVRSPRKRTTRIPNPAPGRMFVVGRVLDPAGKPVPNASVMVSAWTMPVGQSGGLESQVPAMISHANADGSGRFRLDAPRLSSSRNIQVMAVALAPGYGAGWVEINPDADQPVADITLGPEQVIRGRFFDLQGRPVPGVVVSVYSIQRVLIPDPGNVIVGRRSSEGPFYLWSRVNDWPAWPRPATTDAEGRFTLHGLGRGLQVQLSMIDPRFAPQTMTVETDGGPEAKSVTMALVPAKTITGRVTYADTGKPVPKARMIVVSLGPGQGRQEARPPTSRPMTMVDFARTPRPAIALLSRRDRPPVSHTFTPTSSSIGPRGRSSSRST